MIQEQVRPNQVRIIIALRSHMKIVNYSSFPSQNGSSAVHIDDRGDDAHAVTQIKGYLMSYRVPLLFLNHQELILACQISNPETCFTAASCSNASA